MSLANFLSAACRTATFGQFLLAATLLGVAAPTLHAQVGGGFSLVASFGGGKGSPKVPYAPLVQDAAGNFYGTTQQGGGRQAGTVFSLTAGGTLSRFYRFNGGDGAVPTAPLTSDAAGNFYGTTEDGGYYGAGTAFQLTADGTLTVLHDFGGTDDGAYPEGGLTFGTDGRLYGTTAQGGYYDGGTVFRLDASGDNYAVGYDFDSSADDARLPNAGLILATDGTLYGTTTYGGYHDSGTAFQIATDGSLTILHDFTGEEGGFPDAALLQADDGNFYGTTSGGGPYDAGTVFRLTPTGTLTRLYDFPDKKDGLQPEASLIQASDGLLYGTTYYGGTEGGGSVFVIARDGSGFTTLHSFAGGDVDGANPLAALLQARDGTLYGTTAYGGLQRVGTAYRLALGLPATTPVVSATVKGTGVAKFGVRKARFLVLRTGRDLSQPLTVAYTLGGTAVNGVDYRTLSGSITIPAGASNVRVPVSPLVAEPVAKSVTLTLAAPTNGSYTLGTALGGTVQIVP